MLANVTRGVPRRGGGNNLKAAKIEQWRKVQTRGISQESGRLATIQKQTALIAATTQRHEDVGKSFSTVGVGVGVGGGGVDVGSGSDIILNFSKEKPTLAGLLNTIIEIDRGRDEIEEVADAGGEVVDPLTVAILKGLTDKEYELDETVVVRDFLAFIERNGVQGICNVYQESYANGKKATGFGDFIRGCYFLMQFCQYIMTAYKVNIRCDFWIPHMLSEFLVGGGGGSGRDGSTRRADIVAFDKQNWKGTQFKNGLIVDSLNSKSHVLHFMTYLMHDGVMDSGDKWLYVYTISFPLWPRQLGAEKHQIMRRVLEPTAELTQYVETTRQSLGLVAGAYWVIHVRSGDKYLSGVGGFEADYKSKLAANVSRIIGGGGGDGETVVLIADNNAIKDFLIGRFPCIRCVKTPIGHFGEGHQQDREKVRNTLADFFILAGASKIVSFTAYAHGSGFSRWCAETFEIPYFCYFLAG